jgi:ferrochelatase
MYDIAQVHLSGWSLGVESDAILAERDRLAELAKANIS